MEQTSPEYQKVREPMVLSVFGLLITEYENKKKNHKIESFLVKELGIISKQVYQILLNFTKKAKPTNYEAYFSEIQKRIIINSFETEVLEKKSKELFDFAQKVIPKENKNLRMFCNL